VLDGGWGSGAQCEWLAGQGAGVVDLDLSPAMVEEARRRCGGYLCAELVSDTWRKGEVEVTQHLWRRPLSEATDAFADVGLLVERVVERFVERQPSAVALERFPAEPARVVVVPWFIVYRLRLPAVTDGGPAPGGPGQAVEAGGRSA
jgi:SAM-dependent methyltransferase